jgi:hypothetical protein
MNSLSWFLYAAEVVGNLSTLLCTIAVILMIATLMGSLFSFIANESRPPMHFVWVFVAGASMLFFASFIPSKDTMYAIAASELGQKAVETEIGGKALKAIEQWIDSQVKK